MKDISVIIPFKGTIESLPRLFASIPVSDSIEIILVENSDTPLKKEEIGIDRDYTLLNASECRYAGGARNVGIEAATGKWLIFADSDDYFSEDAFNTFYKYIDSPYDLIYFGCDSVYDDTLEQSDRHVIYNNIVKQLENKEISITQGKLYHVVPWAKMIKSKLIKDNNIRFDEVMASNDIMFSTLTAYLSNNFLPDATVVYIVTTRKGSLANKWNKETLSARYSVALRRNQFLRFHKMPELQVSIMFYIYKAFKINPFLSFKFIIQALKSGQNIFIGSKQWINTFRNVRKDENKNKRYIENN